MAAEHRDPPAEGGAHPVPEHRPEVPGPGRTALQYVVIAIAVILLLAGVVFYFR